MTSHWRQGVPLFLGNGWFRYKPETNLNYETFDPDTDPTSVGSRFRKYVERIKVYALAMNIKDKARKLSFIFALRRTKNTRNF